MPTLLLGIRDFKIQEPSQSFKLVTGHSEENFRCIRAKPANAEDLINLTSPSPRSNPKNLKLSDRLKVFHGPACTMTSSELYV